MQKIGNVLGFIFNKIFFITLIIFTILLVLLLGVTSTVTSREKVKTILSDSDVYNTLIDNILNIVEVEEETNVQAEEESVQLKVASPSLRETLEKNALIDPDELTDTVKAALGTDFLEQQTEAMIDSVYNYLDGTTDEFEFSISLKDRADAVATEFKALAATSLEKIPACTTAQEAALLAGGEEDFNILEAECLPAGLSVTQEIDQFIDEATAEDGVFGGTYDQDDLGIKSADLLVPRLAYTVASKLPLILWSVFIGLSAIVIMTSSSIYGGFKRVGIVHVVVGILIIAGFMILTGVVDFVDKFVLSDVTNKPEAQIEAIRNIAGPLVESVIGQIKGTVILSSVFVIIFGLISYAIGEVLHRHNVDHLRLPHHRDDPTKRIIPDPEKSKKFIEETKKEEKKREPKIDLDI